MATTKSDFARFVIGEPIKSIVRLKTNTSYQKIDIRIVDKTVQLIDNQNRRTHSIHFEFHQKLTSLGKIRIEQNSDF
jgi:hypothetical protein